MRIDLPDSARLAWWLTSWTRGRTSPDELLDVVLGDDAAHHVVGIAGSDDAVPLMAALGTLRTLGASDAGLALPAEGDPLGLGGPADFNRAALEQGEAVILTGSGLGLVPVRAGRGVVWRCLSAGRRQLPDLGEADRELRRELLVAAEGLADLDVARWRPEVADELMNLRRAPAPAAPAGVPARCVDLAGRAQVARRVCELALVDDGGAVTADEARRRRTAVVGLERVARRALVAACSLEAWPPS